MASGFIQALSVLFVICSVISVTKAVTCYCGGNRVNPSCPQDSEICSVADGMCYKVIEKLRSGLTLIQYGCYTKEELKFPFLCLKTNHNPNLITYCCKNDTMCNKYNGDAPKDIPRHEERTGNHPQNKTSVLIIVLCIMAILIVLIAGVVLYLWCRKSFTAKEKYPQIDTKAILLPLPHEGDYEPDATTGSGAGKPLLVERTIARQIAIQEVIGKGRFGEVYRGIYNCSDVAVKKFSPRDEASWKREREIFQTHMLRHANILGFIAADNKDCGTYTELWIISDYHAHGSLYDFLSKKTVTKEEMLTMLISIANGLSHLHIEIPAGRQAKPPIAHRDLKSKNILVKNNMECAIADFGHAVRYISGSNKILDNEESFTGTKRYLPPEVLDGTLNRSIFESFSRADIYSLGLVFWEVVRRSNVNGQERSYELPYFDLVPSDPSPEIMKKVVCDNNQRPTIYPDWSNDPFLYEISRVLEECWHKNTSVRLSALRIKKKFMRLRTNNNEIVEKTTNV